MRQGANEVFRILLFAAGSVRIHGCGKEATNTDLILLS